MVDLHEASAFARQIESNGAGTEKRKGAHRRPAVSRLACRAAESPCDPLDRYIQRLCFAAPRKRSVVGKREVGRVQQVFDQQVVVEIEVETHVDRLPSRI